MGKRRHRAIRGLPREPSRVPIPPSEPFNSAVTLSMREKTLRYRLQLAGVWLCSMTAVGFSDTCKLDERTTLLRFPQACAPRARLVLCHSVREPSKLRLTCPRIRRSNRSPIKHDR